MGLIAPSRGDSIYRAMAPAFDVEVRSDGIFFAKGAEKRKAKVVRIDRSLCRVEVLKRNPAIGFRDERKALQLKARTSAPFHDAGMALAWGRQSITVFHWDQERLGRELAAKGVKLAAGHVVLPSYFFDERGDGVELRQRPNGFEAQVWADGQLQKSRWWSGTPTQAQIESFWLAAEADPAKAVQSVALVQHRPTAVSLTWHNLWDYLHLYKRYFYMGVLAVNLLFFAHVAGAVVRLIQNELRLQEISARSSPQENDILGARNRAIASRKWLAAYQGMHGSREQLSVLVSFLDALTPTIASLKLANWEYDDKRLSVTMATTKPVDIKELVRLLEEKAQFRNVNSESNAPQGMVKLTMSLAK